MKTTPSALLAALGLLSLASVGRADVVTTKDGIVLEGSTTKAADGSVTVLTETGEVVLPAASVTSVVAGEGPRAAARREMAAVPMTDAVGHYRLALSLAASGLDDLAKQEYAAVVAADPDHAAARRALGYERVANTWLTTAEARKRSGLVLFDGKWLLPSEVAAVGRGKRQVTVTSADLVSAMRTAATARGALAEAAALRIAKSGTAERVETATALLTNRDVRVRRWACAELKSLGDESCLRPLFAVAARDPEADVRKAAVAAIASFGRDDAAVPFIRALGSEHPSIVANAAQALADLGDQRAVRYLVTKLESHGGSPRSYFLHEVQTSYIQDFDVEVAQTSFIADPQVGVIQEGEVSDVQVLDAMIERTWVQRIVLGSISSLVGAQFQTEGEVKAWFKEHGDALPTFAARAPEPPPPAAGTPPAPKTDPAPR